MEEKFYYKIVYLNFVDKKFMSINSVLNQSNLAQEYHKDRINTPLYDYPMLAFNSVRNAMRFIKHECGGGNSLVYLWKVRGKRNMKVRSLLAVGSIMKTFKPGDSVKEYFAYHRRLRHFYNIRKTPKGTVFLDTLEYVEDVEI